jgi:hypothetical protein
LQISVLVNGDTQVEPNETFFVNLSNPANATISKSQGIGTILDDDGPSRQARCSSARRLLASTRTLAWQP